MNDIQSLSFPVNTWRHLYSLRQATDHNQQYSGQQLQIKGQIKNHELFTGQSNKICINFQQVEGSPSYKKSSSSLNIFGKLELSDQQLTTHIPVDSRVFSELRKNLLEYGEIEGIHIMVKIGVIGLTVPWENHQSFDIVELDYAMKGDA